MSFAPNGVVPSIRKRQEGRLKPELISQHRRMPRQGGGSVAGWEKMKHGTEQETAMQNLYIPALSFQGRLLMDPNGEHDKEFHYENAATLLLTQRTWSRLIDLVCCCELPNNLSSNAFNVDGNNKVSLRITHKQNTNKDQPHFLSRSIPINWRYPVVFNCSLCTYVFAIFKHNMFTRCTKAWLSDFRCLFLTRQGLMRLQSLANVHCKYCNIKWFQPVWTISPSPNRHQT